MPNYKDIYARQAEQYELLVAREDFQGNLLRALEKIRPLAGLEVVELGAGTGRLTCLLAPKVKSLQIFDASQAMLDVACAKLQKMGATHWQARVADHGSLPAADRCADLALVGWSLCYAALDHPDHWREALGQALGEMRRVLRPGGTLLILETQGTGCEAPCPPDVLKNYLAYLDEAGFSSTWIRTDYKFESLAEAEALTRFFFGDNLAEQVIKQNWIILPECTGLWWQSI
jgi:ubiquinone/menaquinone biosynthesis C-methylase UbiE